MYSWIHLYHKTKQNEIIIKKAHNITRVYLKKSLTKTLITNGQNNLMLYHYLFLFSFIFWCQFKMQKQKRTTNVCKENKND